MGVRRYQRRGIGSRLSHDVEAACIARGVELTYLTVNDNNTKVSPCCNGHTTYICFTVCT